MCLVVTHGKDENCGKNMSLVNKPIFIVVKLVMSGRLIGMLRQVSTYHNVIVLDITAFSIRSG